MKKRLFALIMVVALLVVTASACDTTPKGEGLVVGMITDTGGLGDQSFNDSAHDGLLMAQEDFGIEVKVLQSASADDYGPNLSAFAQEGLDLVLGNGFLFEESMKAAAEQFPDIKFAIVDSAIEGYDNIASVVFKEEESSFLVGVIAGMATESNKIGFMGGQQFPLIEKFQYGFMAGVKSVNPDAEFIVNYTGSFTDVALGKEIALTQYNQGADVIYHASGGCGIGMIELSLEKGFWAIGVDKDQSSLSPTTVLCSMLKRVYNATYNVTKSVVEGTYEGKVYSNGLKEDGVTYSDEAGNLTEDLIAAAEKWKEAIIDEEFIVPSTLAEYDAYTVPDIG